MAFLIALLFGFALLADALWLHHIKTIADLEIALAAVTIIVASGDIAYQLALKK